MSVSVEWKVGMKCWTQYCGPDRQHVFKLCEITGISESVFSDGTVHKIAELKFVKPFMDCGDLIETESATLERLDKIWEIKMAELVETAKVVAHNHNAKRG